MCANPTIQINRTAQKYDTTDKSPYLDNPSTLIADVEFQLTILEKYWSFSLTKFKFFVRSVKYFMKDHPDESQKELQELSNELYKKWAPNVYAKDSSVDLYIASIF